MPVRRAVIDHQPDVFFTTPRCDWSPHVLVRLHQVEAGQLAELIEDAWRIKAPARLRAQRETG